MWSSGPAGAAPARFRRGMAVGTVVDGRGAVLGLLGAGFDRSPGWWGSRWSRAAVAAAANRGTPGSGEVEAGDNGWGASVACVGARGGKGRFNLAGGRLELGARRGCP
jgi:hypothetical protein